MELNDFITIAMDTVIKAMLFFKLLLHKHTATQLTWDYTKPNHFKLIIFACICVSSFTEQEVFMNNYLFQASSVNNA